MTFWSKARGVLGRVAGGIKKGAKWLWKNKDRIKEVSDIGADMIGGNAGANIRKVADQAYAKGTDIGNKIQQMRSIV